ncbi:MAG: hypothetical protein AB8C95_12565 [Phycisphaeraceae bacterium]
MLDELVQSTNVLGDSKRFASQVYMWLGVIVVLAFLLAGIALWLRRRLFDDRDDQPPMGFTLKDLRAMHAQGHLSDEELAAAEEKALSRSREHYLGDAAEAAEEDEPEDLGHLSTGSEGTAEGETENMDDVSDKNPDDEPRA